MKKILLTAAAVTLASSTAFADFGDKFYVKAFGGASMFTKYSDTVAGNSFKLKSKTVGIGGFGVGTYLMDQVRTDVTFEKPFNVEFKKSTNGSKLKTKADVNALFLNATFDAYQMDMFSVNVGASLGMSMVKGKGTYTAANNTATSFSSKKSTNFAYGLNVGASAKLSDGILADVTYSYKDFGKSKSMKKDSIEAKALKVKGHNVTAGVRFEI